MYQYFVSWRRFVKKARLIGRSECADLSVARVRCRARSCLLSWPCLCGVRLTVSLLLFSLYGKTLFVCLFDCSYVFCVRVQSGQRYCLRSGGLLLLLLWASVNDQYYVKYMVKTVEISPAAGVTIDCPRSCLLMLGMPSSLHKILCLLTQLTAVV